MDIELKILDPRLRDMIPSYATPGAAGIDLRACAAGPLTLMPGDTMTVPAGFALHIADHGYAAMALPRSGLGSKDGIVLANLVGLVDSDYQGEIGLALWNRGTRPYRLEPMARVAQLVIVPVVQARFMVVDEFSNGSARGAGGFGSTGMT